MYDKYNDPYSGGQQQVPMDDGSGGPQEMLNGIMDNVKQYWWAIILVLVVLGAGYFAYDFFVGSVKEITFSGTDTEGKAVSATFRIMDASGNEVKTVEPGQKISIRKGTYYVDATASGFKDVRQEQLEVEKNESVKISFEKDLDVGIDGSFPESFMAGEEKKIQATFTNNGDETADITLVLDGDAKKSMELQTKSFSIYPGTQQETIAIKVKSSLESSAIGGGKKGAIRIQGLEGAKIEGEYQLSKFDPAKDLEIRVDSSDKEVKYQNVRTGEDAPVKNLKIQNNTDSDIQDIQVSLDITETEFTEKETAKSWFSFNPSNTLSVGANSTENTNIVLKVPDQIKFPEGKLDESISGTITVKTSFYEKKFNLNFKIVKSEAKVTATGIQESYIFSKTKGIYTPKAEFIDVRNSGDVLLTDFDVRVDCPRAVGTSWLTIGNGKTQYSFEKLAKGETHKVPYMIAVPNSTPGLTTVDCTLGIFYKEPSGSTKKTEVKTIITTAMETKQD